MAEKPAAPADKNDNVKKKGSSTDALVKHHFWILGGAALLTGIIVWYLGTSEVDETFAKDKRTTDQAFTTVTGLKQTRKNFPPNLTFTERVDEEKKKLSGKVMEGWGSLYGKQTALFTVNPKVKELQDLILLEPDERKSLLESKPALAALIAPKLQEYHNNQVLDEDFLQLFEVLNIRRAKGMNAFNKPVAGAATGPGADGLVVWKTPFSPVGLMQRYDTTNAPSIDRVSVTYEDIWTFRSLFGVIAEINKKPIETWLEVMKGNGKPPEVLVDQANVPIKRIDFCDIAQYAMTASVAEGDKVEINTAAAEAAAAAGAIGGALDMGADAGGGNTSFTVGTTGTEDEDKQLYTNRYLDGHNQPVADASNPPYTEFRQMFVQMRVLMDQRLIPVLISQCANAPLPIETRQVRISLEEVDVVRKVDAQAAAAQIDKIEQSPHDAVVTLRGVLYIYTKPDAKRLGQGADPNPSQRDYGVPKRAGGGEAGAVLQAF